MKNAAPIIVKVSRDERMRMMTDKVELKWKRRQSAFCMIYMKEVVGIFPIITSGYLSLFLLLQFYYLHAASHKYGRYEI